MNDDADAGDPRINILRSHSNLNLPNPKLPRNEIHVLRDEERYVIDLGTTMLVVQGQMHMGPLGSS